MNELNIELLQKLCNNNRVVWSVHASERLQQRGILRKDVNKAISTGKIIEQYPESYPYPACLILGLNLNNKYIHVVCGCNGEYIKIITAYYPASDKFESDGETRKEQMQ